MIPKFFDISPKISESTAVFPGDQPFQRTVSLSFAKGDHLDLSSIRSTVHLGAHADAPSHYHKDGFGIDQRELSRYIGRTQVIRVQLARGQRIHPADIAGTRIRAPRVLFSTGSFPDPDQWTQDFNSLSPELLRFLADEGVRLVGIDTPSVDPADSKALESHQILFTKDIAVLEGLVLKDVPEGDYILTALPLNLVGADASPVRAVLWPLDQDFSLL